ncbi:protein LNK1-like isoform X3 [Olea europaea var. sylvestris]|uniref:protein LNK1-like isoform X3 n=1 Tax=Olea europaea var. sylvestris TaxID=158386 RepID=UPI000C1D4465|nr:protein LNK1-like isoform X3 [Olea europaea var. sylvestris]
MSDLCMYQFEDIVWDEYFQSDDHIVPHPGDNQAKKISFQGDSRKKPRCEGTAISRSYGDKSAAKHVGQEKDQEELSTSISRRSTMLEKGSWSRTPHGAFLSPTVRDTIKEASSLASDNTRISSYGFNGNNIDSNGSEVCANDPILNDKCTAVDSNSFSYPLGGISQTDDDLNFFDKNPEDENSSDLLRYDWTEIGNFEDIDRMFRSCDSTFGLGLDKEDELGWFSSDGATGGSGDMLESDFKFSCPESKAMENILEMVDGSSSTNNTTSICDESVSHMPFLNGSTRSNRKDEIEQEIGQNGEIQHKISTNNCYKTGSNGTVNEHKRQSKQQNQSQRKRREQYPGNGCFNYVSNLPSEVGHLPLGSTSHEAFQSMAIQHPQKALVPESRDYLRNAFPHVHSNSSSLSDKTSVHTNDLAFHSPREPSYASSQVQFVENSGDPSFQVATMVGSEKREKLDNHQGSQSSILDPVSIEKKDHCSGGKFENYSDVDGASMVIPAELCSSDMQENSSMNSSLDDISIEAASFQQLQLVMEQLDMRTKLCIRDGLYRLARNAEQRHNHPNPNGGCKDEGDASGAFMAARSNKFTGYMDMETDTNPVDRSIAHLLFHRSSDSASTPVNDSSAFRFMDLPLVCP